jgi:hypothetical protein
MYYKKALIILICVGVVCLVLGISSKSGKDPKTEIVYRYIPRTFDEEQEEPVFVTDIFKTMFSQPGVWEAGLGAREEDQRKVEDINKFFVSQF